MKMANSLENGLVSAGATVSARFRHKLNKLQLRVSQSAGASNPSLKGPPVLSKGPPSFI